MVWYGMVWYGMVDVYDGYLAADAWLVYILVTCHVSISE